MLRRYSDFLKIEWNVLEVLIFCKDHLFQKVRQVEKDRKEKELHKYARLETSSFCVPPVSQNFIDSSINKRKKDKN